MKETDKYQSNQCIRDAIIVDNKEHNRENWNTALSALLKQCHEGSDFLLPVDMQPNPDKPGEQSIFFRLLENPNGEKMLPAFTEPESIRPAEEKLGKRQPVIAMPIKTVFHRLMDMKELRGIVIDPFTNPFGIEKNAVKAILDSDQELNVKQAGIVFYKGDITKLGISCIVNSADPLFNDDGLGEDHAIYEAAGEGIDDALDHLESCKVSEAKITPGYDLHCNYIIHTVGPTVAPGTKFGEVTEEDRQALRDCYTNCLNLAKKYEIHSIAFPAISTGLSSFPLEEAVPIAVTMVTKWLDENKDYGMRVVFACYTDEVADTFQRYMAFLKGKAEEVEKEYGSLENAKKYLDENGNLPEQTEEKKVDKDGNELEADPTEKYSEEEIEDAAARVAKELQQQYKNDTGIQ